MRLRTPPATIALPDIDLPEARADTPRSGEERYTVEVITPIYGGGVVSGVPDKDMPIRASGIMYQIRFWWRLLKFKELGGDWEKIRAQELRLFGQAAREDKTIDYRCRVRLQVEMVSDSPTEKARRRDYVYAGNTYVDEIFKAGIKFNLVIQYCRLENEELRKNAALVRTAVRWWASFGGIGGRTRRGMGSVRVSRLNNPLLPVSGNEALKYGCELREKNPRYSAMDAWKTATNDLHCFRQGDDGRMYNNNKEPKRSLWPEPDSIRNIVGHNSRGHAPAHDKEYFPRAMFGMPLNFRFNRDKARDDPAECSITPKGAERLASQLIIKAVATQENWRFIPSTLRLPDMFMSDFSRMSLILHSKKEGNKGKLRGGKYEIQRDDWWPASPEDQQLAVKYATAYETDNAMQPWGLTSLDAFLAFFVANE
jgi:CRISPR-associated protein Cmr1